MKAVAIFFNSPYLGGAERSIIYQANYLQGKCNFTFFIPSLESGDTQEIEALLQTVFSTPHIKIIQFPMTLFSVSRSGNFPSLLNLLIACGELYLELRRLDLHKFSTLWCNGNKIATVITFFAQLTHYSQQILWHFRDYPTRSKKFKLLWRLIGRKSDPQFSTISNSYSVQQVARQILPAKHINHFMVYNPQGENLVTRHITTIKTVGIVSMLAPWKGLHQIIIWASLFEKQLQQLGIKAINIYGGDIYQTAGEHQHYAKQLLQLLQTFPSSLINFKGRCSPVQIYQDIDLLIHPVIRPEPFGRILIEAFAANIPVISTALGGSGELAQDHITSLNFIPNDYASLQQAVTKLASDQQLRNTLISNGVEKALSIEESIAANLQNALFQRDM